MRLSDKAENTKFWKVLCLELKGDTELDCPFSKRFIRSDINTIDRQAGRQHGRGCEENSGPRGRGSPFKVFTG